MKRRSKTLWKGLVDNMTLLEEVITSRHISNDWDYLALIEEVIERLDIDDINKDNINDMLYDSIDSTIIYYKDQWTILQENCTPQEANWDFAINTFIDECEEVLGAYLLRLQERKKLYE